MVEHLGLAGLGTGDEILVQDIEDILANTFELVLDLLTVVADGSYMLIGSLGLLLLLNRRDDAPGGTARSDNVLVGNRHEITLIQGKFSTNLNPELNDAFSEMDKRCGIKDAYLSNFLE